MWLQNESGVGTGKLVRVRVASSSRQILFPVKSVNQMLPSEPVTIPPRYPTEKKISLIRPPGVMKAICPTAPSENQTLPSGPAVISRGKLKVGVRNSVITPSSVTRATLLAFCSVNQRLPSGPRMIEIG